MIKRIPTESVIDIKRESNYSMRFAINPREYPQVHDFYEFSLVLKGSFMMIQSGRNYVLTAGDFFLTLPGTVHSKVAIEGMECQHINLAFPRKTMNEVLKYLYDTDETEYFKDKPLLYHLASNYMGFLEAEMGKLSNPTFMNDYAYDRSHMRWLLVELLHNVIHRSSMIMEHKSIPSWMLRLVSRFDDPNEIGKGFSVIMADVGLSNEHIIRSFNRYLGKTPLEYFNLRRLSLAANMLSHTDVPIAIISENLGFASIAYFYKKFKQAYGTTPKVYRDSCSSIGI